MMLSSSKSSSTGLTTCLAVLFAILLAACSRQPTNVQPCSKLPAIYPDYIGVTIPQGIAPLNFAMLDDSVTTVDVTVKGERGGLLHVNGDYADFDIDEWHALVAQNVGAALTVTVQAEKDGQWTRYRDFPVHVSREPLKDWGITYRRIAPGYESYSDMGIYQRELSSFDEQVILENKRVEGMCLNCHTSNRTNPDQFTFHVRGEKGATVVGTKGRVDVLQAKNEGLGGSMVYPYWHPGGRYCAFSTNKTSQMFHMASNKRIEVYDSSSDVFVYDTETHTILADTLIMKKLWAETCPAFSPDGRWLYFVTARRKVYPTDYDKECYDLCRVAFDETTGKIGTEVDTLVHAAAMGKSVSWPRPSFDGRYVMYTQANYGYFLIWHPEADLWLLDLQTGETRPMREVNTARAESYHNWSIGSRWFLFTSRRDDGLYSRVYLSMVDDKGNVTKPFLLPQRNPKRYYRLSLYSFNTPDFTSRPVVLDSRGVSDVIVSGERIPTTMKE